MGIENMTGLMDLRLDNNPLKVPPMEVCIGGVLQPIGMYLAVNTARQGQTSA